MTTLLELIKSLDFNCIQSNFYIWLIVNAFTILSVFISFYFEFKSPSNKKMHFFITPASDNNKNAYFLVIWNSGIPTVFKEDMLSAEHIKITWNTRIEHMKVVFQTDEDSGFKVNKKDWLHYYITFDFLMKRQGAIFMLHSNEKSSYLPSVTARIRGEEKRICFSPYKTNDLSKELHTRKAFFLKSLLILYMLLSGIQFLTAPISVNLNIPFFIIMCTLYVLCLFILLKMIISKIHNKLIERMPKNLKDKLRTLSSVS